MASIQGIAVKTGLDRCADIRVLSGSRAASSPNWLRMASQVFDEVHSRSGSQLQQLEL